jgi:hypothetical protein
MTKSTAQKAHELISRLEAIETRLSNWDKVNTLDEIYLLFKYETEPTLFPTDGIKFAVVSHFRNLRETILQDLSELH